MISKDHSQSCSCSSTQIHASLLRRSVPPFEVTNEFWLVHNNVIWIIIRSSYLRGQRPQRHKAGACERCERGDDTI